MERELVLKEIMAGYHEGMPFNDAEEVSEAVLEAYARHALFLRENVEWCRELPEDIFRDHVAACRINNERIEDCRKFFFDLVYDKIAGMEPEEAIKEVNMWCCENAAYHQADNRTANAMTVYKSGFGRCGEESVFVVTVLRSVGLAARQVYAPLWSHCDDNHAWVEVWCGGKWMYLGACEPEPVLNKGWFDIPASRAMLIHARSFGGRGNGQIISREGCAEFVNVTEHYAKISRVVFSVKDACGSPLSCHRLILSVLNYGHYGPIAELDTDEEGKCGISLGRGDVLLETELGGEYRFAKVNICGDGVVEVLLSGIELDVWKEYEFAAPLPGGKSGDVTQEQEKECAARVEAAKFLREKRLASCFDMALAEKYPEGREFLKKAGGNFPEVYAFLDRDEDPDRMAMLSVLAEKDLYDLKADVLEEHLRYAKPYKEKYPAEIYCSYILNPRVEQEELSCYREKILQTLTDERKSAYREKPELIWDGLCSCVGVRPEEDYKTLRALPLTALLCRKGNGPSAKILCVAVCRSLGIPARMNPEDSEAEYYRDGEFRRICPGTDGQVRCSLEIHFSHSGEWKYFTAWTLSRWGNGRWEALDLESAGIKENQLLMDVDAGIWRLISVYRKGDGNQLVRELFFQALPGSRKILQVSRHSLAGREGMQETPLPKLPVMTGEKEWELKDAMKGRRHIVIWLEEGKEPSEHILNEMLENREVVLAKLAYISLVSREQPKSGGTLEKVMEVFRGIRLCGMKDWGIAEETAARMGQAKGQYPLAVVCEESGMGIFAVSGYHVGSIPLLLQRL